MLRPLALLLLFSSPVRADDWPQWRGPNRDGVSRETGLLGEWPKGGPKLRWTIDTLGVGYSSLAVVGDRLFTMGGVDGKEQVLCLDASTGKEIWRVPVGAIFTNDWGDGPRGTPTVDRGDVFALGAHGGLVCLDAKTGTQRWAVDLKKDFGGRLMRGNFIEVDWGYAEAPLVDGDRVVVCPGGPKGTAVALDRATGKPLWTSDKLTHNGSYSSAVVAEIGGVRQYVVYTGGVEIRGGVLMTTAPVVAGLRATTGEVLWSFAPVYRSAAIIPTPLVSGDLVYSVTSYTAGSSLVRVTHADGGFTATKVYADKTMNNYHGGVVLHDGRLYGHSQPVGWVCADFRTGERKWEKSIRSVSGSVVIASERLYALADDGKAWLAKFGGDDWEPTGELALPRKSAGRAKKPQASVSSHPVVANGRLYIRDQELLHCYEVAKP